MTARASREVTIDLATTPRYSLAKTVVSHGWLNLVPFRWDEVSQVLHRIEYVGARAYRLAIRQPSREYVSVTCSHVNARARAMGDSERRLLGERVVRMLSTDEDTSALLKLSRDINPAVAEQVAHGGGRLLRGSTLFEDAVKTLFTTNASWRFTQLMVMNIVDAFGIGGAFPSPEELRGVTEQALRERVRCGYRARALVALVHRFLNGTEELDGVQGPLFGFGDYASSHLEVLQHRYGRIPIDSEVRAYCRERHGIDSDPDIIARYRRWGDYAFLGYKLERHADGTNWNGDTLR